MPGVRLPHTSLQPGQMSEGESRQRHCDPKCHRDAASLSGIDNANSYHGGQKDGVVVPSNRRKSMRLQS